MGEMSEMYPSNNYEYNEYNNNIHYNNGVQQHAYEPLIGMIMVLFSSFILTYFCSSTHNNNENLNQNLIENNLPIFIITTDTNEICSICLDEFVINDEINKLECEHKFHKECLDDWFTNNNCPLCRKLIV